MQLQRWWRVVLVQRRLAEWSAAQVKDAIIANSGRYGASRGAAMAEVEPDWAVRLQGEGQM
jgi:hypothetical protein